MKSTGEYRKCNICDTSFYVKRNQINRGSGYKLLRLSEEEINDGSFSNKLN